MILDPTPMDQRFVPSRPRVVIVEDDPALLSALQFSLEAEGYEVRAFATQSEILARREVFLAAACLVVDYRMAPLDGLELCALLQGLGFEAPAILVTSHPDEECRRSARALGVKIVEKPLLTNDLSRVIGEMVDLRL